MKRVYREVRVAPAGDGWCILLDARTLQTPVRTSLLLPQRGLAEAIAAEWDAQTEKIVPDTMPLMQLAATAIDRTAVQRGQVIDEIVGYAQTDLVCYRAERPPELAARQSVVWQPLVDWVTLRFDAPLLVTTGVVPKAQPAAAIAAIRAAVEPLDPLRLTASTALRPPAAPSLSDWRWPNDTWTPKRHGRLPNSTRPFRSSSGARMSRPPRAAPR
jgi:chaperone required for assembly of F1-ATPase